jgi:large subunit ribosomal protein L2
MSFLSRVRWFSHSYSPLIKRNRVPFVDFETGAPKWVPPPAVSATTTSQVYSVSKQAQTIKELPKIRIFKGRVIPQLSVPRVSHSGRNNTGTITTRHKGGGNKTRLRLIDYKRARKDIPATVLRIEYCPNRSSHVALIQYNDGVLSYIVAPLALRPGHTVIASENAPIEAGNCLPLRKIPIGSIIHNIELRPGAGAQLQRAAGVYGTLVALDDKYATVRLKSTELRRFDPNCWAVIGQVSNTELYFRNRGKAGVTRWLGIRPRVAGTAQTPTTHPHGGGTAHRHTKRPPVSPWGVHRSGMRTRSPTKPLGMITERKLSFKLQKKFGIRTSKP